MNFNDFSAVQLIMLAIFLFGVGLLMYWLYAAFFHSSAVLQKGKDATLQYGNFIAEVSLNDIFGTRVYYEFYYRLPNGSRRETLNETISRGNPISFHLTGTKNVGLKITDLGQGCFQFKLIPWQ